MGRRDDLVAAYAADLRDRCGIEPDMALLEKIAIGCGPAIYDPDAAYVAPGDAHEIAHIRENFLVRKLDLLDGPDLSQAIEAMLDLYGRDDGRKHRAVLYYMLTRHFGRESAYP